MTMLSVSAVTSKEFSPGNACNVTFEDGSNTVAIVVSSVPYRRFDSNSFNRQLVSLLATSSTSNRVVGIDGQPACEFAEQEFNDDVRKGLFYTSF